MGKLTENINSSKALIRFLKEKGGNHSYYKFYTSNRKTIDNIINQHALFLSNGTHWNDLNDRNNFNPSDLNEVRYGLCMSYTKSESVAMWMLYGRNNGIMIDFPKSVINSCLSNKEIECGNIKGGRFVKESGLKASDYVIEIVDMVYFGEPKSGKSDRFYIKRADETVQECPIKTINRIDYCKKSLPWQYECECRMIVKIKKSIGITDSFDTVKVPFDESLCKNLMSRIYHSPNHRDEIEFKKSSLTGKIEWNISIS